MPVQKTVTAYTFEELSEEAKKRAREKARDINTDDGWYEHTIEDADTIAALMGIELDRRSYRTKTGEKKESGAPDIQFSGFACQGDGASFTGSWTWKEGGPEAVRQHAPQDEKLHAIADELDGIGSALGANIRATIHRTSQHYAHEHTVSIDLEDLDETSESEPRFTDEQEKEVAAALRAYMEWIYRQLEQEYEYLTSDEAIDETLIANEYLFTVNGSRHHTL